MSGWHAQSAYEMFEAIERDRVMSDETGLASLKIVREFFGMNVGTFRDEWTKQGLTDDDKREIRKGLADGTMTY